METSLREPTASRHDTAVPAVAINGGAPLRIAHVVTFMDVGGVPDHILTLCRGLRRRGHEVAVICGGADARYRTALAEAGIELIEIPLTRAPQPINDVRAFRALWRLARERRFDVVHTHRTKAALLGLVAARMARVPITVNTSHVFGCFALPNAAMRGVFWLYDKLLFAVAADAVVTVSRLARNDAVRVGVVPERKARLIYCGIDQARFARGDRAAARRALGIADDTPVIVTVARLVGWKGLDLLIAAAARLVAVHPDARFLIVGHGPLRDALMEQARALGIASSVLFLGTRADIPDLLKAADIFALSSLHEGLPLAMLEAMAAGTAVVATAVDGVPEAVTDGETGLIVRSRDPQELADAIDRLVRDEALRRRLAENGRARIEAVFSQDRMVDDVEAMYRSMLRDRADASPHAAAH